MEQVRESLSVLFFSPFKDSLAGILWCVFIAVALVLILAQVQKATLGKVVKKLREAEAFTPEGALSLKELGKLPASAYKGSTTLLGRTKDEDGSQRFYLPESSFKKADALLKNASTPIWLSLLELAGLYLVLVILYYLIPWMFSVF